MDAGQLGGGHETGREQDQAARAAVDDAAISPPFAPTLPIAMLSDCRLADSG
jgi:hypothetical protein